MNKLNNLRLPGEKNLVTRGCGVKTHSDLRLRMTTLSHPRLTVNIPKRPTGKYSSLLTPYAKLTVLVCFKRRPIMFKEGH